MSQTNIAKQGEVDRNVLGDENTNASEIFISSKSSSPIVRPYPHRYGKGKVLQVGDASASTVVVSDDEDDMDSEGQASDDFGSERSNHEDENIQEEDIDAYANALAVEIRGMEAENVTSNNVPEPQVLQDTTFTLTSGELPEEVEKENPISCMTTSSESVPFFEFTIPSICLDSLKSLHARDGDFWIGSICPGSEVTNAMVVMLGRACMLLGRSWGSLSLADLELLVQAFNSARALGFKVDSLESVAGRAQKMLHHQPLIRRYERQKAELEATQLELEKFLEGFDTTSIVE